MSAALVLFLVLIGVSLLLIGIYFIIKRCRRISGKSIEPSDAIPIIPTIPKNVTTISVQSRISKAKTNTTWAMEEPAHRSKPANAIWEQNGTYSDMNGQRNTMRRYDRILTESDMKNKQQKDSVSTKKKFSGRITPFASEFGKFVSKTYKKAMSVPGRPKPEFQQDTPTFTTDMNRSLSSDNMCVAEAMGLLHLQISHRQSDEQLIICILRISEIDISEMCTTDSGSISPSLYITGCLMPGNRRRFKSKDSALIPEPQWEETFTLNYLSFSAIGQMALKFCLMLRPSVGQRSINIGSCMAVLQNLELDGTQNMDIPLIKPPYGHSEFGDIHLSLCYQPSSQRLVCLVIEAKDLPKSTIVGTRIQSFVRIDIVSGDKKLDKQKTKLVKEATSPIWTDQMVFTIPLNIKMTDITFNVYVIHKDMVKGGHTVGQVELGSNAVCDELEHWVTVLQNPNRPIAAWHCLQSSQ